MNFFLDRMQYGWPTPVNSYGEKVVPGTSVECTTTGNYGHTPDDMIDIGDVENPRYAKNAGEYTALHMTRIRTIGNNTVTGLACLSPDPTLMLVA